MTPPADTDGRRLRSQRTRARIVEAAIPLFVAEGYFGTTIEAIAERAGVSTQSVYYVFGTKAKVLAAVLDTSIVGDAEPAAVLDRPWFDRLGTLTPHEAVGQLVDGAAAILHRAAPIYEVLCRAGGDPEVAILLEDNRRHRRADQRRLAELLHDAGLLHPDLPLDTAADVIYGLVNEDVYLLLSVDCGWSQARFARWATDLMVHQLTAPPTPID